jgi:hypothetical protein
MKLMEGSLICGMGNQEGDIVICKIANNLVVRSVNKNFVENLEETGHVRDISEYELSGKFTLYLGKHRHLNCIFLVSMLRTHISWVMRSTLPM